LLEPEKSSQIILFVCSRLSLLGFIATTEREKGTGVVFAIWSSRMYWLEKCLSMWVAQYEDLSSCTRFYTRSSLRVKAATMDYNLIEEGVLSTFRKYCIWTALGGTLGVFV